MQLVILRRKSGQYYSAVTDRPEFETKEMAEACITRETLGASEVIALFDFTKDLDWPDPHQCHTNLLRALAELYAEYGRSQLERLINLAMDTALTDRLDSR
jgi:uncharacterized protein YcgI (DUF1989 family)